MKEEVPANRCYSLKVALRLKMALKVVCPSNEHQKGQSMKNQKMKSRQSR